MVKRQTANQVASDWAESLTVDQIVNELLQFSLDIHHRGAFHRRALLKKAADWLYYVPGKHGAP